MNYKKIIFHFFSIILSLSYGCRKYDECTAVSLRSGEAVLLKGVWRIEKYEVNGVDSTYFILNNPNYADVEFKADGIKSTSGQGSYTSGIFKGYYQFFGSQHIDISGNDSLAQSHNALFARDTIVPSDIRFHITCLKQNHFWIMADYPSAGYTYNKNNYYIKFKNVK